MFKQFLNEVNGSQVYLITSLAIFMIFFLIVTVLLFMMKKDQIKYMSELPLTEDRL